MKDQYLDDREFSCPKEGMTTRKVISTEISSLVLERGAYRVVGIVFSIWTNAVPRSLKDNGPSINYGCLWGFPSLLALSP